MKSGWLTFLLILELTLTNAQAPAVEIWDRRFGGFQEDHFSAFQQTIDSGYILGGYSYSGITGDKTQNNWDTTLSGPDYWIVKIDKNGNRQWNRRYGGIGSDAMTCLQQTADKGYIMGGFSGCGISGDITVTGYGEDDYWIIKVDSQGNKQWDNNFGGSNDEILNTIQQTKDGGYIFGGSSNSGINGNKTQPDWDSTELTDDYWVVKTDSAGNKQWDKRFGGYGEDGLYSVLQTKDGGYILGGLTYSDSGGDITQPPFGGPDYWIVKIDSTGNKQWDKRFGGSGANTFSALIATADGNYLLGGTSGGPPSGNKTAEPCGDKDDYWIVKIDTAGNKIWDKEYGGTDEDDFTSLIQANDDGYLLCGHSASPASCQKSENNMNTWQSWIVKTDSIGNKQWDKTILINGWDRNGKAIQTYDGCYAIINSSQAEIGGYKTQMNWDSSMDYWIVVFCDTGAPEGVKDLTSKLQLNVYPNPFSSEFDISITQQGLQQANFTITNMLGQTIYTQRETNLSPAYTKMLDLSYLPNGVYLLEVEVDGERICREVVKQ